MTLPTNATRDAARTATERRPAIVAEVDLDKCQNIYGGGPCTAGRLHSGAAVLGGVSALLLSAAASAVDNAYNGKILRLEDRRERRIISYLGLIRLATLEADWPAAYLKLPGTAGNYASTPDAASLSPRGDIEWEWWGVIDDLTPAAVNTFASKIQSISGSNQSWLLRLNTNGAIRLYHSLDGSTGSSSEASTVTLGAAGFADGDFFGIKVTYDADDGAGNRVLKYYTATDRNAPVWTQLGAAITLAGAGGLFLNAQPIEVGMRNNGATEPFAGRCSLFRMRAGIAGPLIANFDPTGALAAATTVQAPGGGELWTINTSGSPSAVLENNWPLAYLSLLGEDGNHATTPDSAAVSLTGDLDIRALVALDDWLPGTNERLVVKEGGAQGSYRFLVLSSGLLRIDTTDDGTNFTNNVSSVAPSVADGELIWVRATLDLNDGGGNRVAKFYTSADGVNWTQLGTTVTTAGVVTIFDGTAALSVGATSTGLVVANGKIYYAEVRNGIGGARAAVFDARDFAIDALAAVSSATGETWTINQSIVRVATIEPDVGYDVIDRSTACYNTFRTCQDQDNYVRGVQTVKFTGRGSPIAPGETLRPYITSADALVTAIDPEAGHARRSMLTLEMADEPDSDVEFDPYIADRATPAQGTFWARLLKRTPNHFGRPVRVRRGYVIDPWDWDTFTDERYIIETIKGPARGRATLTLKDPTKLLDRNKIPLPTDGKLVKPIQAIEHVGIAAGGSLTTIVLATDAQPINDYYNGMETKIIAGEGQGQRQVVTDYAGSTRTATVAGWAVAPNITSVCEVSALSIELTPGKGAQYPDPAVSLKREFISIGKEVIEYTARAGDKLNFPSSDYRAQFGSAREDHALDTNGQLGRAFINARVKDVIKALCTEGGMALADLDAALLDSEDDTWLGEGYSVTHCVIEPLVPSFLLGDLVRYCNAVTYWSPVEQRLKFRVLLPDLTTPPQWADEDAIMLGSVEVEPLEDLRRTQIQINYGLRSPTANLSEVTSYALADQEVDAVAQSVNDHGDVRPEIVYSRWFTAANQVALRGFVARKLSAQRDAPKKVKLKLDPKDYTLAPGEQVDILTRDLVDDAGAPLKTRCLVVRSDDRGREIAVELRTTRYNARAGFIAPDGTADYPTDKTYCHISENTGLMSDGTDPYVII